MIAHNEEKGTSLKFEKVISGETQLVSGAVNYRLDIEALEDDIVKPLMNKYQAVVYENNSPTYRLSGPPIRPSLGSPINRPLGLL